jgi:2-polyprenyl-3-methyl-5-hydroxy-6-metoxy-1,4-benzoquinol methylase
MFEFHTDRKRYFDIQLLNTEKYVIPFIQKKFDIKPGMRVLEIGCGEGGVLKAFVKMGCMGVGVELDAPRVEIGAQWMADEIAAGKIRFVSKDIYKVDIETELGGAFDIILLKDVIEHIHDQPKLIEWMKQFLQPGGVIFFGFPPWQMPFGGHQQMCKHKFMASLPYYHLLPAFMYRGILKMFNEPVEMLMEIKETGISIERFERICRDKGYVFVHKTHYLLNPIYEYKFGWKPRKQATVISAIPYVRDFLTTCVYYLITPK